MPARRLYWLCNCWFCIEQAFAMDMFTGLVGECPYAENPDNRRQGLPYYLPLRGRRADQAAAQRINWRMSCP